MNRDSPHDSPLKTHGGITFRKLASENRHGLSSNILHSSTGKVTLLTNDKSPLRESLENPRTPADVKGKGISSKRGVNFSMSPEPRIIEHQEEQWLQRALFETVDQSVHSTEKRSALTDVSNSPIRKRQRIASPAKKDELHDVVILQDVSTPVKIPVPVFRDEKTEEEKVEVETVEGEKIEVETVEAEKGEEEKIEVKEETDLINTATETVKKESDLPEDPFSLDTLTANLLITEIVDVNAKESGIRKLGTGKKSSETPSSSKNRARRGIARTRGRRGLRGQERKEEEEENKEDTPDIIPEKATARFLRRRKRDVEIYEVLSPPQLDHSSEEEQNKEAQQEIQTADEDEEEDIFTREKSVDDTTTKSIPQAIPPVKKHRTRKAQPESLLPLRHFVNPSMTEIRKRKKYREQVQNHDVSFTQQMRDADDYIAREVELIDEGTYENPTQQKEMKKGKGLYNDKQLSERPAAASRRKSYSKRQAKSRTEALENYDNQQSSTKSTSNNTSESPESVYSMGEAYTDTESDPKQLPLSYAIKEIPTKKQLEEERKRAEMFAALREKFAEIDKWKLRVDSVDASPDDASFSGYATVAGSSSGNSQQSSPAQSLESSPPSEAAEEEENTDNGQEKKEKEKLKASVAKPIIPTTQRLRRTRHSKTQDEFSEDDIVLVEDTTLETSENESLVSFSSDKNGVFEELDKTDVLKLDFSDQHTPLAKSTPVQKATPSKKLGPMAKSPISQNTPRNRKKSTHKRAVASTSPPKSASKNEPKTKSSRRRTRSSTQSKIILSALDGEIELLE